ncbi:MAG TPA: hypothetical protein VIQ29_22000 [Ancylobacter sp.]
MIGKWARVAVLALAISALVQGAGVPIVGAAAAQGGPPPASASAQAKAAWAKAEIVRLTVAAGIDAGVLAASIQALMLAYPALAGELTTAIADVATNGATAVDATGNTVVIVPNPSLALGLANGVAAAVTVWQSQSSSSPVAPLALAAVNAALASAAVTGATMFGGAFVQALQNQPGALVPAPIPAGADAAIVVVATFLQKPPGGGCVGPSCS